VVGVEQWAEVRRLRFVRGLSIREIHRRTGLRRETIRSALKADEAPRHSRAPAGSKFDPFRDEIQRHPGGPGHDRHLPAPRRADRRVYRDHAKRLERAVRGRVPRVGDEVIDDACHTVWLALLRRPDIRLDAHGLGWLSTVAVHEAWRLGSITREQPAGTLTGPADLTEPTRPMRLAPGRRGG
jgi:hypothetical protein